MDGVRLVLVFVLLGCGFFWSWVVWECSLKWVVNFI